MKALSELPWRCSDEIKSYLLTEALVSPPDPMAFYLMTKETVIAAFRFCWDGLDGINDELQWSGFREFSCGDWTPTKIFEWLEFLGLDTSDLERPQ